MQTKEVGLRIPAILGKVILLLLVLILVFLVGAFAIYNLSLPEDDFARGKVLAERGNYGGAIKCFDRVIESDPDNAAAYYNRGLAYWAAGFDDKALPDFSNVIRLTPDNANAYFNRGCAHQARERHNEAIADFSRVIQLNPNDADAFHKRSSVYRKIGEKEKADADARRAKELDPNVSNRFVNPLERERLTYEGREGRKRDVNGT